MHKFTRQCLKLAVLAIGGLCLAGLLAGAAKFPQLLILLAVVAVYFGHREWKGTGYTFGTARLANHTDLAHAGYLGGSGLLVGTITHVPLKVAIRLLFNLPAFLSETACRLFFNAFEKKDVPVRLQGACHSVVVAPPGAGKGTSIILPHLLTHTGSMVVIDPKLENFKLTHRQRRRMGHTVVVLDPFKVATENPDTFNPLDCISQDDPNALDMIKAIAEALVVRSGKEHEPHWADSAEMVIAALIALICCDAPPELRNLQSVATLAASPTQFAGAVAKMQTMDSYGGLLKRLGGQLGLLADREKASVLTTVNRNLAFLSSSAVVDSTLSSSFGPNGLRTGKMTIYLGLPTEYLRSHSGLMRMWIATLLRVVIKGGANERNKVTFLIDEAASLKRMQAVEDALVLGRGYGIRLLMAYQSLGQLKECFPEGQDQTFLASMDNQIYFGVNDITTAKHVSDQLGETTVKNVSVSGGTNKSKSIDAQGQESTTRGSNDNWNVAEVGRHVLKPEEIIQLPKDVALIFAKNAPPMMTRLVPYYTRAFRKLRAGSGLVMSIRAFTLAVLTVGFAALMVMAAAK